MAKTEKKREEKSAANVRRRLSAALVMLLISAVMLVTSTYAWFTLSTAPEVRGIDTSVAGNGSLEIALMPNDGTFASIGTGRNASGTYAGGSQAPTVANNNWGNIVNLSDATYGLDLVTLRPAQLNVVFSESQVENTVVVTRGDNEYVLFCDENNQPIQEIVVGQDESVSVQYIEGKTAEDKGFHTESAPTNTLQSTIFTVPEFGYDGRPMDLKATTIKSHYTSGDFAIADGFTGNQYGVRAIVDDLGDTYGYVVDLALRLNTVSSVTEVEGVLTPTYGKLLLQVAGVQRIYEDGNAGSTQGAGSTLQFRDENGEELSAEAQTQASQYLKAIKIAFIQDLGRAGGTSTQRVLAYARPNISTGNLALCDYYGNPLTTNQTVILDQMLKNQAYQISAVVWLDGNEVTNANMAISNEDLNTATLNLQFATDVELVPAQNTNLKENPPAPVVPETTPAAPESTPVTTGAASDTTTSANNEP